MELITLVEMKNLHAIPKSICKGESFPEMIKVDFTLLVTAFFFALWGTFHSLAFIDSHLDKLGLYVVFHPDIH